MGQVAEPRAPTAGSTERVALHPYPACYSVPIKRAPLSGAKEAQCPDTASGHAGFFCLGENPNRNFCPVCTLNYTFISR